MSTRVTEEEREAIRAAYARGENLRQISTRTGRSYHVVQLACAGTAKRATLAEALAELARLTEENASLRATIEAAQRAAAVA